MANSESINPRGGRPTKEFRGFIEQVTRSRPGVMGAGEQAACLWWSSLAPQERELVHRSGQKPRDTAPADAETADRERLADEMWHSFSVDYRFSLYLAFQKLKARIGE